jgi:hypothetical protein
VQPCQVKELLIKTKKSASFWIGRRRSKVVAEAKGGLPWGLLTLMIFLKLVINYCL